MRIEELHKNLNTIMGGLFFLLGLIFINLVEISINFYLSCFICLLSIVIVLVPGEINDDNTIKKNLCIIKDMVVFSIGLNIMILLKNNINFYLYCFIWSIILMFLVSRIYKKEYKIKRSD